MVQFFKPTFNVGVMISQRFVDLAAGSKKFGSIINVGVLWTLLFTRPLVLR